MPGAGNLISGNTATPLSLFDAAGSVVQGNIIGPDITGTKVIGNGGDGIDVSSDAFDPQSGGVLIGGPLAGEGNLISGNRIGINLTTDNNTVQGNLIGTDITGLKALSNGDDGIHVVSNNNLIGGPDPGDGNVISANRNMGVRLDLNYFATTGNVVQGNLIGVGKDGVTPLGNSADGVGVTGQYSPNAPYGDLIGGLDPGDGNIIAYNRSGVDVYNGVQIAILSNSIFNNVALGIDLGLDGRHAQRSGRHRYRQQRSAKLPRAGDRRQRRSALDRHRLVQQHAQHILSIAVLLSTWPPTRRVMAKGRHCWAPAISRPTPTATRRSASTFPSPLRTASSSARRPPIRSTTTLRVLRRFQVVDQHGGRQSAADRHRRRPLHDQRGRLAHARRLALRRPGRRSAHVLLGHQRRRHLRRCDRRESDAHLDAA